MPGKAGQATTVFIVGKDPQRGIAVRGLLADEPHIDVIGESGQREESIGEIKMLLPDVVVIDVGVTPNTEFVSRLRAETGENSIIALVHSGNCFTKDLLRVGVAGVVISENVSTDLAPAVRAVMRGDVFLSNSRVGPVINGYRQTAAEEFSGTDTTTSLLQTKLQRPPCPLDLVTRQRLYNRLEAERPRPLTVVSAAIGYGKSVLISSWLEQCGWPSAWLSLDESDSDLHQFLTYFLAAVKSTFPEACQNTTDQLNSARLDSVATLAVNLSNDLGAIQEPFFLVLDDYQHISAESPVHELLTVLLERPPLPLHLVIVTRVDPPLPLGALRAKGQVMDICARDLMFETSEAGALLRKISTVDVSDKDLSLVQRQVEGWVVGLRLAALALHEGRGPDALFNDLSDGSYQVHEYLVEEVLFRQSLQMQECMLHCSILDRFSAALCEAVCITRDAAGVPELDGRRFIDALQQGNLFITALDARGEWFRFHEMFRDLLREQLERRAVPGQIVALHARASEWFESQGMIEEAIHHALAAGDEMGAAAMVERHHRAELDQILNSKRVVEKRVAAPGAPIPAFCELTNRELDILELISQRLQNKEIAARLFVTPETVKTHLKHLYEKLHVHSRHEAAAKGAQILAANTTRFDA